MTRESADLKRVLIRTALVSLTVRFSTRLADGLARRALDALDRAALARETHRFLREASRIPPRATGWDASEAEPPADRSWVSTESVRENPWASKIRDYRR